MRLKPTLIVSFIVLVLACVHFGLVVNDPILARDDRGILDHLRGFGDLLSLVKGGRLSEVVAYQPVRDASYFFDLWIQKHIALSSFHFTNFAIWIAIVACVYSLLKSLHTEKNLALEMAALFAVHPIFVDSVGWISARKHLLSCLFILFATQLLIGFQKKKMTSRYATFGIFIFYCLSILSQPINLLWPVWAFVYSLSIDRQERRPGLLRLPVVCTPILIAGGIANFYYYLKLYPIHTSALRWADASGDFGTPFLALGRYFFNLLIPVRLALVYYPGSLLNLLGLVLLALSFLWITAVRKVALKAWLPWFLFFLFPLLPVIVKSTNIFVSDTYILVGAFGILNLFILAVGSIWKRSRLAYLLVFCAFVFISVHQAATWESDRSLWMSSYAVEPSPRSLAFHAKYLIEDGKYTEAAQEALLLESWDPEQNDFALLFGKSIYLNPEIATPQKITLLKSHQDKQSWIAYYLASTYAKEDRYLEAYDLMSRALAADNTFGDDLSVISAEAQYFCLKSHDSGSNFDCKILTTKLRHSPAWNEKLYQDRITELTSH